MDTPSCARRVCREKKFEKGKWEKEDSVLKTLKKVKKKKKFQLQGNRGKRKKAGKNKTGKVWSGGMMKKDRQSTATNEGGERDAEINNKR